MAAADYRLCDVCGGKAFYDSNLCYEDEREAPDRAPYRIAGEASDWGYRLGYLGDWAVVCDGCAKTHRTRIEPIVAARELDVEAERREFEAWLGVNDRNGPQAERVEDTYSDNYVGEMWESWQASAARFRAEGGNTKPEGGLLDSPKSAETRMNTSSEAGHLAAPVSTEQAGDAWISVKDRLPEDDCRVLAATWFTMTHGQHQDIVSFRRGTGKFSHSDVTHWMHLPVAPSPNNSPVGGKG